MQRFCVSLGLGINIRTAKAENVVFNEAAVQGSWSLQARACSVANCVVDDDGYAARCRSRTEFIHSISWVDSHESGKLGPMLLQLHCTGQDGGARLQAKEGRLGCMTSVPRLLRLSSSVVAPAVPSGYLMCTWGSPLQGRLDADADTGRQGLQLACLRQVHGRCTVGIPAPPSLLRWLGIHAC